MPEVAMRGRKGWGARAFTVYASACMRRSSLPLFLCQIYKHLHVTIDVLLSPYTRGQKNTKKKEKTRQKNKKEAWTSTNERRNKKCGLLLVPDVQVPAQRIRKKR
jgi:hypothetical protein